jgi:hypothetical protein
MKRIDNSEQQLLADVAWALKDCGFSCSLDADAQLQLIATAGVLVS